MAKRCELTGTGVQSGNNVSHSKRRTRRRFLPNLQNVSFISSLFGTISLKVTAATIRSVDHNGGLDGFLLNTRSAKLTALGQKMRRKLKKALPEEKKAAAIQASKEAKAKKPAKKSKTAAA